MINAMQRRTRSSASCCANRRGVRACGNLLTRVEILRSILLISGSSMRPHHNTCTHLLHMCIRISLLCARPQLLVAMINTWFFLLHDHGSATHPIHGGSMRQQERHPGRQMGGRQGPMGAMRAPGGSTSGGKHPSHMHHHQGVHRGGAAPAAEPADENTPQRAGGGDGGGRRWDSGASRSGKCAPRVKLAYLKTHKTGSSTLTNIFHRIALTYNASVVLPKSNLFLGWPSKSRIDES